MSMIRGMISLTIAVIVLSTVFIPQVTTNEPSNLTSGEQALYGVLTLAGILGVVYGTFAVFGLV